ncbi:pirin family protein [Pelagibius sp.]|uniref:pirin family protein n=1 Tax=Pelagibius sp. TaxID=1931238 RepID=UPI003B5030DF
MIEIKPFDGLGQFHNEWLAARYHFSFAGYYDPAQMGVGSLRVWNDDTIRPGTGFDMHGHRDMEIITYVREGAITHQDHLGNKGRTEAGDIQVMSAGTGIMHAEFNQEEDPTKIFQIWIEPAVQGVEPRWETRSFPKGERAGELVPLASGRPEHEGALPIHQDAAILGATLKAGQSVTHRLDAGRHLYLVPATGRITVNDAEAGPRDGVVVSDLDEVVITAKEDAEILLADVA